MAGGWPLGGATPKRASAGISSRKSLAWRRASHVSGVGSRGVRFCLKRRPRANQGLALTTDSPRSQPTRRQPPHTTATAHDSQPSPALASGCDRLRPLPALIPAPASTQPGIAGGLLAVNRASAHHLCHLTFFERTVQSRSRRSINGPRGENDQKIRTSEHQSTES